MPLNGVALRTPAQLFQDGLSDGNGMGSVALLLSLEEGAAAAGGHLTIGGSKDNHISIPENSVMHVDIVLSGWKDSGAPLAARRQFAFSRTTGAPVSLTLTGATLYSNFPGAETFAPEFSADGTIKFKFTGANSSKYELSANARYSFAAQNFRPATLNKVVNP